MKRTSKFVEPVPSSPSSKPSSKLTVVRQHHPCADRVAQDPVMVLLAGLRLSIRQFPCPGAALL